MNNLEAVQNTQEKSLLLGQLHTYKGLAATLGITSVQDVFEKNEKLLQQTLSDVELKNLTLDMINIINATLPKLETLLDELDKEKNLVSRSIAPVLFDPANFKRRLNELCELLENADMAATDRIDQFPHLIPENLQALFTEMKIAIADLDFERAQLLCQQLLESDLS